MKNLTIITQAMELYSVGIDIEKEKQKLQKYVSKYGLYDPETVKQLEKVEGLTNKFDELEKKHIAATEKHAGINSSLINGN